jgi:hypothetical protein
MGYGRNPSQASAVVRANTNNHSTLTQQRPGWASTTRQSRHRNSCPSMRQRFGRSMVAPSVAAGMRYRLVLILSPRRHLIAANLHTMASRRVGVNPDRVEQPAPTTQRARVMPRNLIVGAVALIVGIALGFGGTWAMTSTTQDRPVPVGTYDVFQNDLGGTEITVSVTTGSHAAFTLVLLAEKPDRVEVTVRERVSRGLSTLDLTFYRFTWMLSEPLGSRPVVDASTQMEIVRAEPAVTAIDPAAPVS